MKKVFYTGKRVFVLQSLLCLFCVCSFTIKAQTYYSKFDNPTSSDYSTEKPSGNTGIGGITPCNAPDINDPINIATGDLDKYASINVAISLGNITCSNKTYRFRTKINFAPSTITATPTNYNVGFHMSVASLASLTTLVNNLKIATYTGNSSNANQTFNAADIAGLNILANTPFNLTFATTQSFDQVELQFDASSLSIIAQYQFYYAFATSNPILLPVKLTNFNAKPEGKNIQVSWQAATEQNLAKYEVEKSDGNGKYYTVATVPVKANANDVSYSFTDHAVISGDNIYRLKMTDKDGSVAYSKIASVKSEVATKWKVYPTILSSGTALNVVVAGTDKKQLQLTNLQGQVVRSVSTIDSKTIIATSSLPAGIYVLKILSNGQVQAQQKIVVQ